jgi:DNA end-binding protein Ku
VTPKELELAQKLVADMSGDFNPEEFEDTYNEDLMKRIEEKIQKGETHVLTKPEQEAGEGRSAQVIDLMELLKRSIDKTAERGSGRAAKGAAPQGADEEAPAARTTRARKSAAAQKATAEKKPAARRKRA